MSAVRVPSAPEISYREQWWFSTGRGDVWEQIERFDRYPQWWSWLRDFEATGGELRAGTVLAGRVVPPVPYPFRIKVTIVGCIPPASVDAHVAGDVTGTASMRFAEHDGGTLVVTEWRLRMRSPVLRIAARTTFPVLRWGHDRIVERTVASFASRALDGSSAVRGREARRGGYADAGAE